jgi:hypothetical protein
LPSSDRTQDFGEVNSALYHFYIKDDKGLVTSLASSFNQAVQNLAAVNPGKPWLIAAHSLGGALATLGALDAYVSESYGSLPPIMVTFGSLHVGTQTFADAFNSRILSFRFANLCDFVPSLVSLLPVTPDPPYVHVGLECTFVWQKWDDWANHSMQYTYLETLEKYYSVIKFGPRKYPQ